MSAVDDPHTLGRARLSFARQEDVDEFVATLERFERGELSSDEWRAFRLLRGTYGQRQEGNSSMIRVKVPQGILDGPQLRAFADVADQYSRGFAHVTTRQNLQLHFVDLADVAPALQRFAEVGLTTREACGNSVRNVSACPWAGVSADELFDVTPYAEALTRHLLRHPLASALPRKFKMAFEGCAEDHAQTPIHDLAFRAVWLRGNRGHNTKLGTAPDPEPDAASSDEHSARGVAVGVPGFRVLVGGGTSVRPTSAQVLDEALPAGDLLAATEAVLRIYQRRGDYQHRQKNRIKYLVRSMGFAAFRAEYEAELAALRSTGVPPLPFPADAPPEEGPPRWPRTVPPDPASVTARVAAGTTRGPGLHPVLQLTGSAARLADLHGATNGKAAAARLPGSASAAKLVLWAADSVHPQRQPGYDTVTVRLPLGDITSEQLRVLAELAAAFGDGTVRTTAEQNLLLRWVPSEDLPALHQRLAAAGLAERGAGTLADVVSCPGAESCKLAITRSRGLGRLLVDAFAEQPGLAAAARGLDIKVSGCPNGCSRHHVAGIGFQGSVRRLGGRLVPQYFVNVGGGVDERGATFGRLVAKVPVRRGPEVVARLITLYQAEGAPGESALAFLQRLEPARAKAALADLEAITLEDALPEDFVDLGDAGEMTVVSMEGECSA
jgi:sulfite reductase (NADPH) hemoprotein beta-component